MAILLVFLLGLGNFALHKAVIESRHPLVGELPRTITRDGGRIGLALEFAVLLGALLLVANGHPMWGWAYFGYSALNGVAGWLILARRV